MHIKYYVLDLQGFNRLRSSERAEYEQLSEKTLLPEDMRKAAGNQILTVVKSAVHTTSRE